MVLAVVPRIVSIKGRMRGVRRPGVTQPKFTIAEDKESSTLKRKKDKK